MDVKKEMNCGVLVVGGGNAGLCAAISARNAGANVLVIEKAPKKSRGGNSRLSGALFRIPSSGFKDYEPLLKGSILPKGEIEIGPYSKDEFYNHMMELSEGKSDKLLTEIFVNQSYEIVMWMKEQGVQWDLYPDYMYKVGNRLVWPSGLTALEAVNIGEGLAEMLYGILENKGVEVLYETAGHSLIVNADGAVCGVIAKDIGGLIRIDAKNVILTCGGFQANNAMRRSYLGENWDLVKVRGTRYDTGDGIKMALDIGAQPTGHWGGCHASVVSEDSPMLEATTTGSERYCYNYGIMVNRNGERFFNEGIDFIDYTYAHLGKEVLKEPGGVAFQIFDAKVIPLLTVRYKNGIRVESNSLKELAEELDLDVKKFLKTIKEYNEAVMEEKPFIPTERDGKCTKGLNPDKTNWALKIDTPPYWAYAVVCGLTMTYGGLKTNEKAQAIDTADRPIKGLYAAGEITGGFFYHNYPSGTGLVRGAVMGRIAGAEAAATLDKPEKK